MKRPWLFGCIGFLAAATAGLTGLWAYNEYQKAVLWPAKLQREILGREIVSYEQQIDRDVSYAWGEGMGRWRYRVEATDPQIRRLCATVRTKPCKFIITKNIDPGVTLHAIYDGDTLMLEEWWF